MTTSREIILTISNPLAAGVTCQPEAFAVGGLKVVGAATCREAFRVIRGAEPIAVIVCDVSLPDGNWYDVLWYSTNWGTRARMVLRTDFADERLWSVAIWSGVYDLLVEPCGVDEVRRVIGGALAADYSWSSPTIGRRPPGREVSPEGTRRGRKAFVA